MLTHLSSVYVTGNAISFLKKIQLAKNEKHITAVLNHFFQCVHIVYHRNQKREIDYINAIALF